MFDIGFSEMLVIGVVALVVVGPEKLPRVARTAGHLLGRVRRYAADVKADINREIELADFKKMQQELHGTVRDMQQSVKQELDDISGDLNRSIAPAAALVADAAANDSMPQLERPTLEAAIAEAEAHTAKIELAASLRQNEPSAPQADPNQLDMFGHSPASTLPPEQNA